MCWGLVELAGAKAGGEQVAELSILADLDGSRRSMCLQPLDVIGDFSSFDCIYDISYTQLYSNLVVIVSVFRKSMA